MFESGSPRPDQQLANAKDALRDGFHDDVTNQSVVQLIDAIDNPEDFVATQQDHNAPIDEVAIAQDGEPSAAKNIPENTHPGPDGIADAIIGMASSGDGNDVGAGQDMSSANTEPGLVEIFRSFEDAFFDEAKGIHHSFAFDYLASIDQPFLMEDYIETWSAEYSAFVERVLSGEEFTDEQVRDAIFDIWAAGAALIEDEAARIEMLGYCDAIADVEYAHMQFWDYASPFLESRSADDLDRFMDFMNDYINIEFPNGESYWDGEIYWPTQIDLGIEHNNIDQYLTDFGAYLEENFVVEESEGMDTPLLTDDALGLMTAETENYEDTPVDDMVAENGAAEPAVNATLDAGPGMLLVGVEDEPWLTVLASQDDLSGL